MIKQEVEQNYKCISQWCSSLGGPGTVSLPRRQHCEQLDGWASCWPGR